MVLLTVNNSIILTRIHNKLRSFVCFASAVMFANVKHVIALPAFEEYLWQHRGIYEQR